MPIEAGHPRKEGEPSRAWTPRQAERAVVVETPIGLRRALTSLASLEQVACRNVGDTPGALASR